MFTLSIKTDNDAFGDDPAAEVVRILLQLADDLPYKATDVEQPLRDANGNRVGSWKLEG